MEGDRPRPSGSPDTAHGPCERLSGCLGRAGFDRRGSERLAGPETPHDREPDRLASPVGVGFAVEQLVAVDRSLAVGDRAVAGGWAPADLGLVAPVLVPAGHRL